jgi:hypothetical protein
LCKPCFDNSNITTPLLIKINNNKKLPRGIKFAHVNVRDILTKTKKDDVRIIIQQYNFDVFVVSESWLKPTIEDDEIFIPNYNIIRRDRPGDKKGGGLLIYVKEDFEITTINSPFEPPVESLIIELKRQFLPKITVVAIYRPEKSPSSFIDKLGEFLVSQANEETLVLGDFNLNQYSDKSQPFKLKSVIFNSGFKQVINRPTRITPTSETLLDLILTNTPELMTTKGVWNSHLADHEITYIVRKRPKNLKDPITYKYLRNFKNLNQVQLKKSLSEAPWWALDVCKSVHKSYAMFIYLITMILDQQAPYRKVKLLPRKPVWWTKEFTDLSKQCETLRRKIHKNPTSDRQQYNNIRNQINGLKIKSKAKSIQEAVDESRNQPKEAWRLFNAEIGRKRAETGIKSLNINGCQVYDKKQIADCLGAQFSSVPDIPNVNPSFPTTTTTNEEILNIDEITENEVSNAIKKLKKDKPTGYDFIPCRIFKDHAEILTPVLANIFNRSIKCGEFPDLMKISIVNPLYKKKGAKNDPKKNYRAIAIIPIIAKLFEMIICDKLSNHLIKTNFLDPSQHGFRRDHSTLSALMTLVSEIFENTEEKLYTGVCFLDFTNAFNLVDFEMLLMKLKSVGLSENLLKWFSSYINGRKILVQQGDTMSKMYDITAGIPAGSNLGPLCYAIFINDLPSVLSECDTGCYADDARISVKGKTKDEIINKLNKNLEQVSLWSDKNKALVNCSKTEWMLFHGSRKEAFDGNLKYKDEEIKQVKQFKYLGVRLDPTLKFDEQFNYVLKTMLNRIKHITRYKKYFNFKYRKIFCCSLILSLLDYAIPIWGFLCNTKLDRLDTVILKMINYVILDKPISSKWEALSKCSILSVHERRDVYALEFVYKHVIQDSLLSPIMRKMFPIRQSERNFRDSSKIMLPNTIKTSCHYQIIKIWNELTTDIKMSKSLHDFDIAIRQNILKNRQNIYVYQK